jgi:tyrosine aminotransferase
MKTIRGLEVVPACGAMYNLVRLDIDSFDDEIQNDLEFAEALLKEENVFVLPGSCFGVKNMFRVVFCAPTAVLDEAVQRIRCFCERHSSFHHPFDAQIERA